MWNKIKKNIFVYFLWAFVAVVIVVFEFSYITRIKDDEKINFFISSTTVDEGLFYDKINSNKPSYLRSVSYRKVDYNNETTFSTLFTSYGASDTDIFIVPLSKIKTFPPQNYFFALNQEKCNEIFEKTLEYYVGENGFTYGFKINHSYFTDPLMEFYILFAKSTHHMGELGNTSLDGNITYARIFLNEE